MKLEHIKQKWRKKEMYTAVVQSNSDPGHVVWNSEVSKKIKHAKHFYSTGMDLT